MISRLHYFKSILIGIILPAFLTISFTGCTSTKKISINNFNKISIKPFPEWSVDDCNTIIELSTVTNRENYITKSIAYELSAYDVFVSAMPMTDMTIKAIAKKEALLKRLPDSEFKGLLKYYFNRYTNYDYDTTANKLVKKDIPEDSLKGLTFQVVFQNNTDPYRPIILDEGYDYFFLENKNGDYARVVEISGKFAETDFYLTDYLGVNITFNAKSVKNKLMFNDLLTITEFKLVFNGIDEDQIVLNWKLLNNTGAK